MGAILGQLTNIDELGQASMGFHGDPAIMQHDPYRCALTSGIIPDLTWQDTSRYSESC